MKYIKAFESLFDKLPKTVEDVYWKLSNSMLKDIIVEEYKKVPFHNYRLDFDKLYVRKYTKEHKLVIIIEYQHYNIIVEYFLKDKTIVGNVFDYKSNEQLYQLNSTATTMADVVETLDTILTKIANKEL